ncbi:uncharacterized protein M6B38_251615 [Iris pallida]|uniref:Uncharacterized protein n=1 Tax=Iris pallida TaxID=29817 RepID=A0AAX6IIP8_IRIPA|nr:uncharacterized protein M6B38_251615 [Iris pallida]
MGSGRAVAAGYFLKSETTWGRPAERQTVLGRWRKFFGFGILCRGVSDTEGMRCTYKN